MTTGEKIKEARKRANMTQKELGDKLGVSPVMISQYESDKRKPKIETLERVATALNVPISAFLDGLSEPQHIKSVWEWIQSNDEKRKELIIEILKTHNYQIKETNRLYLTITDYQGFNFLVRRDEFQEMTERCDKDIRYNIEKLLNESKPLEKE